MARYILCVLLCAITLAGATFVPSDEAVDKLLGRHGGARDADTTVVYKTSYDTDGSHMKYIFFGAASLDDAPATAGFPSLSTLNGTRRRSLLSSLDSAYAFVGIIAEPLFGVDAAALKATSMLRVDDKWTRVSFDQSYNKLAVLSRTLSVFVSAADSADPQLKGAVGLIESDDALAAATELATELAGAALPALDVQATRDMLLARAVFTAAIQGGVPRDADINVKARMDAATAAATAAFTTQRDRVAMGYVYASPSTLPGGARYAVDLMDESRGTPALVLAVVTPTIVISEASGTNGATKAVSARVTLFEPHTLRPLAYIESDEERGFAVGTHVGLERLVFDAPDDENTHLQNMHDDSYLTALYNNGNSSYVIYEEDDTLPYVGALANDVNELLLATDMFYNAIATVSGGTYRGADGHDGTFVSTLVPKSSAFLSNAYVSSNYAVLPFVQSLIGAPDDVTLSMATYLRSAWNLRHDFFPVASDNDNTPVLMRSDADTVWHELTHVVQFNTVGLPVTSFVHVDGSEAIVTLGYLGSQAYRAVIEHVPDLFSMSIDILESAAVLAGDAPVGVDHIDAQQPSDRPGAFAAWTDVSDMLLRDPTRESCSRVDGMRQGNTRFLDAAGDTVASGLFMSDDIVTAMFAGSASIGPGRDAFTGIDYAAGPGASVFTGVEFVVATAQSVGDTYDVKQLDVVCEYIYQTSADSMAHMAGRWVISPPPSFYFDVYTPAEYDAFDEFMPLAPGDPFDCLDASFSILLAQIANPAIGVAGIVFLSDTVEAVAYDVAAFFGQLGIPVLSSASVAWRDIFDELAEDPLNSVYTNIASVSIEPDTFIYESGHAKFTDPSTRWITGAGSPGALHLRDHWAPHTCRRGVPGLTATSGNFPCSRVLAGEVAGAPAPITTNGLDRYYSLQPFGAAYATLVDGGTIDDGSGAPIVIEPIGLQKALHILWRFQSSYMFASMGYVDTVELYHRSCLDLVGTPLATVSVTSSAVEYASPPLQLTVADCDEVDKAMTATGFRAPANEVCPALDQLEHFADAIDGNVQLSGNGAGTPLSVAYAFFSQFMGFDVKVALSDYDPSGLTELRMWIPFADTSVRPVSAPVDGKRERRIFFDGESSSAPVNPQRTGIAAKRNQWLSLSAATDAGTFINETNLPEGVLDWRVVDMLSLDGGDVDPSRAVIVPEQLDPTVSNGRYAFYSNRYDTRLVSDRDSYRFDQDAPVVKDDYAQQRILVSPQVDLGLAAAQGCDIMLDFDLFVRTKGWYNGAQLMVQLMYGTSADAAALTSVDAFVAAATPIVGNQVLFNGPNSPIGLFDITVPTSSFNIGPVSLYRQDGLHNETGDIHVYWGNWDYFGVNAARWMPVSVNLTSLITANVTALRVGYRFSEDGVGQQYGVMVDNVSVTVMEATDSTRTTVAIAIGFVALLLAMLGAGMVTANRQQEDGKAGYRRV
jgi:hypothetical protein